MENLAKQTFKVEKKFYSFCESGSLLKINAGNISLLMSTNHKKTDNFTLNCTFSRQLGFF